MCGPHLNEGKGVRGYLYLSLATFSHKPESKDLGEHGEDEA